MYILLYSHLLCISNFGSTCGFISEILLAVFEMQISCLATDHDIRLKSSKTYGGVMLIITCILHLHFTFFPTTKYYAASLGYVVLVV